MAKFAYIWVRKKNVSSLIAHYKTVKINNHEVKIRPMILSVQIVNDTPTIPNTEIENIFKSNNVQLYSQITLVKAGILIF